MSVPAHMDLSSLTAADADWFDQVAVGKRAAAAPSLCCSMLGIGRTATKP